MRAAEVEARDLQAAPRAVMIPEGVRHFYLRLGAGVKLRRASPLRAARPVSIKRLTLKQKRARKAEAADDAAVAIGTHSLLLALDAALAELKPASALVFICRSAGLTVRRATRELRALGLPATALHEAIGLEHDAEGEGGGGGGGGEGGAPRRTLRRAGAGVAVRDDPSERLQQRHARVAAAFAAQLSVGEGGGEGAAGDGGGAAGGGASAPLLVTFEDMARGLHFDAVEAVFILGLPDSPATYLHLAGRTGRQPVLDGQVITLCPRGGHTQLLGWSERLGGVEFQELRLDGEAGAAEERAT